MEGKIYCTRTPCLVVLDTGISFKRSLAHDILVAKKHAVKF